MNAIYFIIAARINISKYISQQIVSKSIILLYKLNSDSWSIKLWNSLVTQDLTCKKLTIYVCNDKCKEHHSYIASLHECGREPHTYGLPNSTMVHGIFISREDKVKIG